MKPQYGLALATLAGLGIGAATVQILHAQAKPPGYLISDVTVTDEEAYKEYVQKFPDTLSPFGGKFLVRAGQTASIPGAGEPSKRAVVVVFDSFEKAKAWSESEAIKAIRPIRDRSAKIHAFLVEGVAN
jgi:uncharacterized protein (DUF1330 family)